MIIRIFKRKSMRILLSRKNHQLNPERQKATLEIYAKKNETRSNMYYL